VSSPRPALPHGNTDPGTRIAALCGAGFGDAGVEAVQAWGMGHRRSTVLRWCSSDFGLHNNSSEGVQFRLGLINKVLRGCSSDLDFLTKDLRGCSSDLDFITKVIDPNAVERLKAVGSTPFKRLSYTDAIQTLQEVVASKKKKFEFKV
jgi:hypothetical protein